MGLFHKKHRDDERGSSLPKLPELPRLPDFPESSLPQFPSMDEDFSDLKQIHQLPSFPTNSFGQKFSQNTIKNAVSGQEKGDYEDYEEGFDEEVPMIPKPLKREIEEYKSNEIKTRIETMKIKEIEPIFIRIDKFEESLKIFEQTKDQIHELENLLKETKDIKDKENQELNSWETELQTLRSKIEKVDKDLFSKVK
jgi:hypothetical protein